MRRARILLVDGFDDFRDALAENLTANDFKVFKARDVDEAIREAKQHVIDMALIELRVTSPGDPYDFSGVRLGKTLKQEIGIYVILTAGQTPPNERVETWKDLGYIDEYQPKRKNAAQRHREIRDAREDKLPVNFRLDVTTRRGKESTSTWNEIARSMAEPPEDPEDIRRLFYRLFPKHIRAVELTLIPSGAGGAGLVHASVTHRDTRLREHVVVKFGRRSRVRREEENFDHYIAPLDPRHVARKRWSAEWQNLWAIAYGLVRDCPTLADYLLQPGCNAGEEAALIATIFDDVFKPWYNAYALAPEEEESTTCRSSGQLIDFCLSNLWADRDLKGAIEKLEETQAWIQELGFQVQADRIQGCIGEIDIDVPDPAEFIRANHLQKQGPTVGQLCIVHGDLHARNIFVVNGKPCIIDFGDAHLGHPFRDFATLEVSVRFGVFCNHDDPRGAWALESLLADISTAPSWSAWPTDNPRWEQAARITHQIRNHARRFETTIEDWSAHYAFNVMLCFLKLAGVRRISGVEDSQQADQRRQLAYLVAGNLVNHCRRVFAPSPDVAATASPRTSHR